MANPIKVIKLTGVSGSLEGKADVNHDHVLADITDAGSAAAADTADFATADQGTKADNAIQAGSLASINANITDATLIDTTDPRLSDARTPITHSHTLSEITDSGTAAGLDVPTVGNASASEVVKGNDSRLSDERDPTAHTHTLSDISDSGSAAAEDASAFATAAQGTLATTALQDPTAFATSAQGDLASTAVQPEDIGTAAASAVGDFATSAQGDLASTAVQPEDIGTAAASAVGDFATAAHNHPLSEITDNNIVVRTTDSDVSASNWVIDEDTLASDSDTKVPTQSSVKNYIDNQINNVSFPTAFKGAYNANTNTPDLTSPSAIDIVAGDTFIVDTEGSFYGQNLSVGTTLIAETDVPSSASDWTIVTGGLDEAGIKIAYESNLDTNAFTDAEQTKLAGIDIGATDDQTGAEIKALYETETKAFNDTLYDKLDALDANAAPDQTGAEIKALYEAQSNTNAFTDSDEQAVNDLIAGEYTRDDQTSVLGNGWVINDATMATATSSKLATSSSIKSYVDSLTGNDTDGMNFKGDYDATTNTPDLDGSAPREPVATGDVYIVSADGQFWTEEVTTGTLLIANQDDPNGLNGWDIVAGGGGDITTDDLWAAAGDLVYATGTAAAAGLTIGNESDVLTVSSGLPVWSPPAGGGGLANIVEDTTPELGGNLDVGNFEIRKSNAPFLSFTSSSLDEFSLDIRSGTSSGYGAQNPTTISVVDNTGSGFYRSNLKLSSASGNFGAASIELDNYVFQSNENLSGKSGQVLTYDGSVIKLAPAGGAASDLAYGVGWNGNQDAATKNAIYDKIETLGWDITTDTAFDAKGDLIVGTGNNTAAKLTAFPQDGKVLTTASGYATGLAWQDAATGGTTQGSSSTYDISAVARSSTPDARGNYSVDLQMQGNADDVAAGTHSALIGGSFNSAAGSYSSVIGGNSNSIGSQGSKSTIIASSSSSVTYNNSAVIAHSGNTNTTTVSTYNSAVLGGSGNTLDGVMGGGYSAIIGGTSNSGYYINNSVMLGGDNNSGRFVNSSVILGGKNNELEYNTGCVIGGTRVKATGVPLGRLDGVFAYADDTAADYTITQEKTANFRVANGMHISAPLFIDERASALADIAGRGQIWVKNATPNELWFTDDAGSDRPISEGVYTVATLPTGVAGRRAFVTDSGNTLASHHGQVVTNGGANFVPVYHDGSAWHVG